MTNRPIKRPPPFSLRLTPEERRALDARAEACGLSLGGFIRACLFGQGNSAPQSQPPRARLSITDRAALAAVLAQLGASRLASNVNQLAKAANAGSLPVTPDTEQALRAACADIRSLKSLLMRALGIQEG